MNNQSKQELSSLQKPASRYEVYAVGGTVLMHALSAQFVLTTTLLKTLVATDVMSAENAKQLLLAHARGLEKMVPSSELARKVIGHTLISKRLENHAKALRGIALRLETRRERS